MRYYDRIILLVLTVVLVACEKTYQYCPYTFVNQECNYLTCYVPNYSDVISAQDVRLKVAITGYDEQMLEDAQYDKSCFYIESDSYVENQLRAALTSTKKVKYHLWWDTLPAPAGHYSVLEYRTKRCDSIEIYASEELFGIPSGRDISEYMEFARPYHNEYDTPLINSNKQYLGMVETGLQLQEYLEMNPLVFGKAEFKFRDNILDNTDMTVSLRVKVVLEGGVILQDETPLLTIKFALAN